MSDGMVNSKYKTTTTPALPARCIGCNNEAKGDKEFVDLTASIDYYGAIAICEDCVREIAMSCFGLVSMDNVVEMSEELVTANQFITVLTEKMKALERVVAVYGLANWSPGDSDSSGTSPSGEESTDKEPGKGQTGPTEVKQGLFR